MNRKITHAVFVTFLFTLILFASTPSRATALSTYWKHDPLTPGSWHDLANWDNGVPAIDDYAYIDNGGEAQIAAGAAKAYYLYLGYTSGYSGTVTQTSGSNTVDYYLYLGYESGSSGMYNLSGTGQLVAHYEYIGRSGAGEFNQTGGTNTVGKYLYLGRESGSSGTYNQSGGSNTVGDYLYLGYYFGSSGTYNQVGGTNTVGSVLCLGNRSGSSGTYNLSDDGVLSAQYEHIGSDGTGGFNQSGGTHIVNDRLYLGLNSGSSGAYNLSAGQLSAGSEYIGNRGTGEFNQTGGTNTVGYLFVKDDSSYTLSAGTLSINNSAEINGSFHFTDSNWALNIEGGLANFANATIDGAGSASFSSADNTLTIFPEGFDPAGEFGSYNASGLVHAPGNTLIVPVGKGFAGRGTIDDPVENHGSIVASGGALQFNDDITILDGGTLNLGSYNLTVDNGHIVTIAASGGQLSASSEYIGHYGTGEFNQTGGTHTVASMYSGLYLGFYSGSSGTYNLSGTGQLSVDREYIGLYGTGEFNQTGGTHTVDEYLYLGRESGSSGTYNQSGGTNTVGYLFVKDDSSYTLSGGTLSIGDNAEIDGSFHFTDDDWTLNIEGGLANFTNAVMDGAGSASFSSVENTLTIFPSGFDPAGEFGSYNASGLVHTAGNTLIVPVGKGFAGRGTIDDPVENHGSIVASGGDLQFKNDITILDGGTLDLGSNSLTVDNGHIVTIAASGGQLSVDRECIGLYGTGEFVQTGGTHTVDDTLYLGRYSGSSGTYNLSGTGQLSAYREYIGLEGTGVFNQTGGTNTLGGYYAAFYLGHSFNSSGTYNLSGGQLTAYLEYIGKRGTGVFNQTGGSNTVESYLYLGHEYGSSGTYGLSGDGVLSAKCEYIGDDGTGEFNQSGGSNTVADYLYLGRESRSSGTYNLSGDGVLSADREYVGYKGTGAFNQSGGMNTVSVTLHIGCEGPGEFNQSGGVNAVGDSLYLGYAYNSGGVYNLSAGELSAKTEYIGHKGTGEFNQSGGSNTVGDYLYLGYNSGSSGTYNLSGGQLSADREYVGYNGTGEFIQTGGSNQVEATLFVGHSEAIGAYHFLAGEISAFSITVGENGYFVNNGSLGGGEILSFGNFMNNSEFPELFSMTHTTLTMWGGMEYSPAILDMNSVDMGADCAGLVDNFALGTLVFEGSTIINPGFYYRLDSDVYTYGLVLNEGAELDLNGHTLYYLPLGQTYNGIATTTQCLGGTWYGGDIVALSGNIIPEPGAILLLVPGILGIAIRVRGGGRFESRQ